MTSNTRQSKNPVANKLVSYIQTLNLDDDGRYEVAQLLMQKLNMISALQFMKKPTKAGRKAISLEKGKVWDFR